MNTLQMRRHLLIPTTLIVLLACNSKTPEYFPEGNGSLWIEFTFGGPHWAICGLYRDYETYHFTFRDKSNLYSTSNMRVEINGFELKQFTGAIVIDESRTKATIELYRINHDGSKSALPINGSYKLKVKGT